MLDELQKLSAAPAGSGELTARTASLIGNYGRDLETTQGLAQQLGNYAIQGVPLSEIGRYDDSVRAVSPEAAEAFAKAVLDPSQAVVVVVGDAKLFRDALKARLPNLEVIPAAKLDLDSPTLKAPS